MSFDLYFVRRPTEGRGWDHVMDELEAAAEEERQPTAEDHAVWDRVVTAVLPIVPEGEVFEGERSRTFDDGVGMQLSMYPGEISLTTPYWYEGEEAERIVRRLKAIVAAVEEATGLVAYDPQADRAFLGGGADSAAETFDRIHDFLEQELGSRRAKHQKRPRRPFWRR